MLVNSAVHQLSHRRRQSSFLLRYRHPHINRCEKNWIYIIPDTGLLQNIFKGWLFDKTNKENNYPGLLRETGGCRVSALCILAPYSKKTKIEEFLVNFIISFLRIPASPP